MRLFRQALLSAVLAATSAGAEDRIISAFGPGEQTVYEVSYLGVPTGTATVTVGLRAVKHERDVWPIVGTAFSDLSLYPVKDRYVSYWDFRARRTVGSEFFVDENRKRRRERVRYAPGEKKVHSTKQKEGSPPYDVSYDVPEGTTDLAGAAMAVRNRPLEVGDELSMPIFTGLKSYQMHARVEARETIATPLGPKDCFRTSFTQEWGGSLAARRRLLLWFTADEAQVPVRFEAELILGSLVAEATAYYPGRSHPR